MKGRLVTVTSALPYVNGVKHLGNIAGSLLPADIFHRFMDLFDVPNIYICGTDDHGAQVEIAALKEKMKTAEYADKYHNLQAEIYRKWNFDFTHFGRTATKSHHMLVQKFFLSMNKKGFIRKGELTLPYCKSDKLWLADRYVEGGCPHCKYGKARGDQCENCSKLLDPTELKEARCSVCGKSEISFKKSGHLFLDLAKLQPQLQSWVEKQKQWPDTTKGIALGWLKEGLKPRCITRNLEWGVPVPLHGYKNLVFYVWFDAPIGYISITEEAAKAKESKKRVGSWRRWWTDAKIYHFLAKDNVPFHTIFWPGILLAARSGELNFALPHYVAGYEYLNWEGQKFSTSRSVGLFSDKALDLFPADYWRYYLASALPERKDANFEWQDFQSRVNNELIASYGNGFHRITSFIKQNFGPVPKLREKGRTEDELERHIHTTAGRVERLVKKVRLRDALKEVMLLSDTINSYFQSKEPWFAIRNPRTKKDVETTLNFSANALAAVTVMLWPFIPTSAEVALRALGLKEPKWDYTYSLPVRPGAHVRPLILFQRIEDAELEAAKKSAAAGQAAPEHAGK